ncbi:MAG: hypothetical protein ACOCX1_05625 [Fimbriimonadaceae bacterium]
MKLSYLPLGLLALGLLATGCNRGEDDGMVVARVGEDTITQDELYDSLRRRTAATVPEGAQVVVDLGSEFTYTDANGNQQTINLQPAERVRAFTLASDQQLPLQGSMLAQALQSEIQEQVVLDYAEDEGALPTEDEVDAEIARQQELQPTFMNDLKEQGLTLDEVRENILTSLASFNLQTRGVTVADSEVDDLYQQYLEQFVPGIRTNMEMVLAFAPQEELTQEQIDAAPIPTVDRVDELLGTGASLASVYSQVNAENAEQIQESLGQIGTLVLAANNGVPITISTNPDAPITINNQAINVRSEIFLELVQNAEPGDTLDSEGDGWIELGESLRLKVRMLNKERTEPEELTDAQREEQRRRIMLERGGNNQDFQENVLTRILDTQVEIRDDLLEQAFDAYLERIREQAGIEATDVGDAAAEALENAEGIEEE